MANHLEIVQQQFYNSRAFSLLVVLTPWHWVIMSQYDLHDFEEN